MVFMVLFEMASWVLGCQNGVVGISIVGRWVNVSTHHHVLNLAGSGVLAGPITRWHGMPSIFLEHAGTY